MTFSTHKVRMSFIATNNQWLTAKSQQHLKIFNFYCSFPLSVIRFPFFYIYLYPEPLALFYGK